ncbi:alpha/beta fold hydrolase [Parapedobacter sp. GCM10030251]|uniref:alpha/beta fold hydrolase n=1 Tax=Parapedobacter sp. GCM10030251 TaxID=3273419 RepID=UPI003618B2DB
MSNTALTVQTHSASIENRKIAYRRIGSGTPIILANRFRGTLDTWDPLFLDLLAEKNTVITFDYPGIGYSEGGELPINIKDVAQEVIRLADNLNIDKFHLLGWSYGTFVTQYATWLVQDRVLSNTVIGGNPVGKNEVPLEPLFLELALKPNYEFEDWVSIFFEPASVKSRAAAKASTDRIYQRLDWSKVPSTQEQIERYIAGMQSAAEDSLSVREGYKTLEVPTFAISGDHDISLAVENWFPLLKNAPSLQHFILHGAGHAPHYQSPELIVGYIQNFHNQIKK